MKLLCGPLVIALYTIRGDPQLMEQIAYNVAFPWLVGFSLDDEVWNQFIFKKSRSRLLAGEFVRRLFAHVFGQASGIK